MQAATSIYPTLNRDLARISNTDDPLQRIHTQIPIEGVGVVHVITEVDPDDPGYAFSDVTLARYRDGELVEHIPLVGSVCESLVARCMHEHWCDVERAIRCVHRDMEVLCLLDMDWELDDDESPPDPLVEGSDPGETPRVLALYERALGRSVRIPDLHGML
ncbi:hypothetical protein [Mycolicibacterium elephantis]|uniref:hypothetical protein n=1 Tax=Mycolicibacterium elephantis TaxID=81858 RepID=UPI0007EB5E87|nr:hypothetical protein [Mycolicibacterium elephantis]OBB28954.1 hypothetical protein A5762_00075 [Mycolicibacterium elephantis]